MDPGRMLETRSEEAWEETKEEKKKKKCFNFIDTG